MTARLGGGLGGIVPVRKTTVNLPDGSTVRDLMELLSQKVGEEIFAPYVLVVVNGRRIDDEGKPVRLLRDGDVVAMVIAVAGG
ncbi:MAG: MoaD/ThiS family protein [Desulfitobacteriaceae bacterium]